MRQEPETSGVVLDGHLALARPTQRSWRYAPASHDTGLMADPAAYGHPLCPFCGGELLPEQKLSEDHVFERSLGGRVVITAHRTCNNQSGSAAEGNLQRPNTVINIIKAAKGLHTSPVQGVFSSGRPASVNFRDGSVHSPPIVHKADDGTALRIEGTPAEAENAYSKWRARNPAP
jgi:hypothetical protein